MKIIVLIIFSIIVSKITYTLCDWNLIWNAEFNNQSNTDLTFLDFGAFGKQ